MRALRSCLIIGCVATLAAGCDGDDGEGLPAGEVCAGDSVCASRICSLGICVARDADADGDGLSNALEHELGSDLNDPDTDGDELGDRDEIVDGVAIDTDGDGTPDFAESYILDQDRDCITDQYDSQDRVISLDLTPMRDVVCHTAGICASQLELLRVTCSNHKARCFYDRIQGYHDPEISCDKVDENCDGTVDEGFAPGCVDLDYDDDGIEDAVDVCPEVSDRAQGDHDGDGIGNACMLGYTLELVAPLPPAEVVAGAPFDVRARMVRVSPPEVEGAPPPPRYLGTVTLTSLPEETPLGEDAMVDNVVTFEQVTLDTTGKHYLELEGGMGSLTSDVIEVVPGPAERISLSAPSEVAVGVPFTVTAIAYDALDNVSDYDQPATLTASLSSAEIPEGATRFSDGMLRIEGVVLHRAEITRLRLETADGLEREIAVFVVPGPAASIALTLPPEVKAGQLVDLGIAIYDGDGGLATNFEGVVALAVDDPDAVMPTSVEFEPADKGEMRVKVGFVDPGLATVLASHGAVNASVTTRVRPGAPYAVLLDGITATTLHSTTTVYLAIVDVFGHVANDPSDPYLGTVLLELVGGDGEAQPPTVAEEITFTESDGSLTQLNVNWSAPGTWVLSAFALDLEPASLTITVADGPAAVALTLPERIVVGGGTDMVMQVVDSEGLPVPSYTGVFTLEVDDPLALFPSTVELRASDRGSRLIPIRFRTEGTTAVTMSDSVISGSTSITVVPADSP